MARLSRYEHEIRHHSRQPISWHVSWLLPRINIHVDPARFVWRRRDRELALPTTVYVDDGAGIVVGVGEPPADTAATKVHLFGSSDRFDDVRENLLRIYFREGFIRLMNRRFMIRPYVVFSGAETLSSRLLGYEKAVLARAALAGGASEISFVDAPGVRL